MQELITPISPEMTKQEGERIVQEGFLSIAGYFGEMRRAVTVKLKAERLLAQAPERGIEHLDGILYTNHLESSEKAFEAIKEEED